ncbi:MAG: amidohydrolase family protein, partial [Alicyclobacillus sp.]|nr:amidohydrolase family protein [Alicyclobacillus sp.]
MLDVLIRNAVVVDGTGRPSFLADIGVQGDRIVAVEAGIRAPAAEVVDAAGLHVSPGFIDVHSHDDLAVLHDQGVPYKVLQGVTTTVVGNCGLAPAPVSADPALRAQLRAYVQPVLGNWTPTADDNFGFPRVSDYLAAVAQAPIPINVAALVAHGSLRIAVMGFSDRRAREAELAAMEQQLEAAMEAGALGLSLGLMYAPGCFADMEELVRLGRVVARHHGVVASHIRGEGDLLLPSVSEMIELARESRVSVHISHLKAVGIRNWGSVNRAMDLIRKAREEGLDVTCDAYPYAAGSTTILSLLP